ncbi:MAG: hypothetical protein JNK58_03885, partial [Phycisphaerae bacterium]|nr:hypothetical protein [Phycisphaerae bacterium]
MRSLSASAGSILTLVLSASIHGQSCVPDWLPTFESGDLHGPVRAFALFDFDAGGPNPTTLVALQAYASTTSDLDVDPANRRPVQRWTGRRWEPVGGPELESVGAATVRGALAVYDPDAEGPLPPALYAASRSLRVTRDGRTSYGIARFDGAAWTHVSMGFTSGHVSILDLQVFDEDGPGPLAPALFAACDHLPAADGVHNLLRLRDDAWSTVGSTPLNAAVANLMVWDPDGAGSMPERLIAAGLFDHSADSPPGPSYLALWNGAQWEPIGAGQPGQPGPALGLALFDPDGNGPATQELYVAAADNPIDGTPRGLLSWNGQQWTHHGVVPEFVEFEGGQVNRGRMAVHDDDGPGPIRPALYVAGVPSVISTSARVSRWSGSDWSVPGHDPLAPNQSGHRYPVVFSSGTKIEAFASFDLDGQGPSTATLLMG